MFTHLLQRGMRPLLLAAALVLPAACARHHPGDGYDSNEPATIVFSNESLAQADLFAVFPGIDSRKLGTVMAGKTAEIRVPSDIVRRGGSLNLVARLLAHTNRPSSGPVTLHPRERLSVRVNVDGRSLFVAPATS